MQPRHSDPQPPQPVQTPPKAAKHDERLQHVTERVVAAMPATGNARNDVNQAKTPHQQPLSKETSDSSTTATATTTTTTATITTNSGSSGTGWTQLRSTAYLLAAQKLAQCEREFERTKAAYLAAKRERDEFVHIVSSPLAPSSPQSSGYSSTTTPTTTTPTNAAAESLFAPQFTSTGSTSQKPLPIAAARPAPAAPTSLQDQPSAPAEPAKSTPSSPTPSSTGSEAPSAPTTSQSTSTKVPSWQLDHDNELRSVLSLLTRFNKKPLEAFLQHCNVLDLDELDPSATAPASAVPVLTFAKWLAQRVRCNFVTISNAMHESLQLSSTKASGDIEKLHRLAVRAERELRTQSSRRRTQWEYVRAVTTRIYAATNDNDVDPLLAFRKQCVATESSAPDLLDSLWQPVLQGVLKQAMETHGFDECGLFFGNASATTEKIVAMAVASLNEILTTSPTEEWENAHVFTCTTDGAAPVVHILVPFGYKALLRVRLFALDFSTTNGVVNSIYNMLAMCQIINYKLEQGHFAPLRVTNETCGHATCHSPTDHLSVVNTNMLHTIDTDTGLMHVLTKRDGARATRPQRTPEPTLSPYEQRRAVKQTSHSKNNSSNNSSSNNNNKYASPQAHTEDVKAKKHDAAPATTKKATAKKAWADWNADSDDDDVDVKMFQ
jgi:hypothetical protein